MAKVIDRRDFLKRGCLLGGSTILGACGMKGAKDVFAAQPYPKEKNIELIFGVAVGGGTDVVARSIIPVWTKYLGSNFKYSYYEGASGEIAWSLFGERPDDGYSLMAGVTTIDVLTIAVQKPKGIELPGNVFFFATINQDPTCLYTTTNSPYKDIKTLIDAAKKKEVNVALSRWTHPGTLGILMLNQELGTKFVGIPYGGGGKARAAMLGGEVDIGSGPLGAALSLKPKTRVLALYDEENRFKEETNNAPLVNQALNTHLPVLSLQIGFAAHTSFKKKYPDRVELLYRSLEKAFKDPEFPTYAKKSGYPLDTFYLSGEAKCEKHVKDFKISVDKHLSVLKK